PGASSTPFCRAHGPRATEISRGRRLYGAAIDLDISNLMGRVAAGMNKMPATDCARIRQGIAPGATLIALLAASCAPMNATPHPTVTGSAERDSFIQSLPNSTTRIVMWHAPGGRMRVSDPR